MIARIFLLLVLVIVLPDIFIYMKYVRKDKRLSFRSFIVIAVISAIMLIYTIVLALQPGFAPKNTSVLFTYLFLLGVLMVPKAVYALFTFLVSFVTKKKAEPIACTLAVLSLGTVIYGSTVGIRQIEVHQETFYSADLPAAFDGYRLVLIADAHVGSFIGWQKPVLEKFVDVVMAQKADAILFAGDLQNMHPDELEVARKQLERIQAKDGVFSILGNHDYAGYLGETQGIMKKSESKTQSMQRSFGWNLLMNENAIIRRGNDSIVIAGMENEGQKHFPRKGDIKKTMKGIGKDAFVIMLQHDPTAWKTEILPQTNAQLTVSGHTHGGQVSLFGLHAAEFAYDEWGGRYDEGDRALYVTTGLSGFVPFRLGLPAEVVVMTLRRRNYEGGITK